MTVLVINTCKIMLAIKGLVPGLDPIKRTYSASLNPSAAWGETLRGCILALFATPVCPKKNSGYVIVSHTDCFKVHSILDFSKLLHILRKLKKRVFASVLVKK